MSIGFRHLEVFKAIMLAGSVTDAAKTLHTSQPTVSRELARFEQLSGLALFSRERGKLYPTPAAHRLMEDISAAYDGLERITRTISALRQYENGQITLTSLPALAQSLIPDALIKFKAIEPNMQIVIDTRDLADLSLENPLFDLGIMEVPSAPVGTDLIEQIHTQQVCVLPPNHGLVKNKQLRIGDFDDQDFIYLASNDPYRKSQDIQFSQQKIERRVAFETVSSATACSLVQRNLGVTIVNPFTAFDFKQRGCVVRPMADDFPFELCIVQPRNRVLSPATEKMVAAIKQTSEEILAKLF